MRNPLFPEQDDEDEREFWNKLMLLLPFLGFLVAVSVRATVTWFYEGAPPEIYDVVCDMVVIVILGGTMTVDSILAIIRRETPRGWNLPSITGIPAVIIGILGTLAFGGAALGHVLFVTVPKLATFFCSP